MIYNEPISFLLHFFKMEEDKEKGKSIQEILEEDPVVEAFATDSAKAWYIHSKYDIDRQVLCEYFDTANSSITRAKQAIERGFDAGKPGRHQLLSIKDEHILERWLECLIEISETVYTSTVIKLVCFFK